MQDKANHGKHKLILDAIGRKRTKCAESWTLYWRISFGKSYCGPLLVVAAVSCFNDDHLGIAGFGQVKVELNDPNMFLHPHRTGGLNTTRRTVPTKPFLR